LDDQVGSIIVLVRRANLGFCLIATVLCGRAATAQHSHDSWKQPAFVLESLTHSLADAPLSSSERAQIYRAVDGDGVKRFSFADVEKDKEREAVMSARVGFIALAENGSKQIVVMGPSLLCGAANCPIWIFIRRGGHLSVALDGDGVLLTVLQPSSKGFHDVATGDHLSGFDTIYRDYRWDGRKYVQTGCYLTRYPRPDEPGGNAGFNQPPTITECP
jgi:hypothetical protein